MAIVNDSSPSRRLLGIRVSLETLALSTDRGFPDFLLGNTELNLDADTLRRLEEISKLTDENKQQVFQVIDSLILGYKAKQTFGMTAK